MCSRNDQSINRLIDEHPITTVLIIDSAFVEQNLCVGADVGFGVAASDMFSFYILYILLCCLKKKL